MGVETGEPFGVVESGPNRPSPDVRFSVQPLTDGRFQIRHPFHGPRTFGDGSVFSDKYIDTAAALLLDTLPYLADSRKLNRTGRFETRPYAGEYAQLSHCVSLGIMAAEFGGGPLDVFDGMYNDATHIYDGHQGDDNYQGHGLENFHDYVRNDFYQRAGLIKRFVEEGVLRANGHGYHFGNTRLYIGTLLSEDEATVRNSFISNKHPARRMDDDRFQYNEEEQFLTDLFRHRHDKDPRRVPLAMAEAALASIQRAVIVEDGEGDQLVFADLDLAVRSTLGYSEQNAMHWCEPVQDLINDMLNLAERYYFVCNDDAAREYQYFYPRDYLHTSAALMFERFDDLATRDPFMKWILDTAESFASDQRQKMANVIDGKTEYVGPNPPEGVRLEMLSGKKVLGSFTMQDRGLVVVLPRGKMRTVDPRVTTGKHETQPVSVLRPDVSDRVAELHQWIGNYEATLSIDTREEAEMIKAGLALVDEQWPKAIARMRMPERAFRDSIAEANDYVRKNGRLAS
jgi:hypothetical protein